MAHPRRTACRPAAAGARLARVRPVIGAGVLSACLLPACLADAPTFGDPGQILPVFLSSRVDPPLGAIAVTAPFSINVPFRSEDGGQPLVALMYKDLVPGLPDRQEATLVAFGRVAPSTYDDDSRFVALSWESNERGCHSMTFMLTYESNWRPQDVLPTNADLVVSLVWWLNLGPQDNTVPISSCPRADLRNAPQ
jgi:hypothetical protein